MRLLRFLQGGGRARGAQPGAAGAPNGQAAPGTGAAPNPTPQPQAFASATGKVVSKSPLTISLGNDITITLKLAPDAKITKLMPVTIASLKVGDTVMASGQTGADGSFTATGVGVNMNMRGGFGGPAVSAGGASAAVAVALAAGRMDSLEQAASVDVAIAADAVAVADRPAAMAARTRTPSSSIA